MKPSSSWMLSAVAVVMVITGIFGHPGELRIMEGIMVFMFLWSTANSSDRLDRIEGKLDTTLQRRRSNEHETSNTALIACSAQ